MEFFWRNFFDGIFLEEFFGRNFLEEYFWEDFFGRIFGRIFFLRGILWEEINIEGIDCLSRFCLNGEGRRRKKISILRNASASISHLKSVL